MVIVDKRCIGCFWLNKNASCLLEDRHIMRVHPHCKRAPKAELTDKDREVLSGSINRRVRLNPIENTQVKRLFLKEKEVV